MTIVRAGREQAAAVVRLALMLWPDNSETELKAELAPLLKSADAAFFLAQEQGEWVGFAQCQLRHDYVEGTSTSPVGYLEGIFVIESCRRQGIAAALLKECQLWAKERGCREFASDCELGNDESLRFHESAGFREANRIVCFTKRI